jgi:hypothetical protein
MPITVIWDTEKHTAVRYEFRGKWTWGEYFDAIKQGYELSKDIPHMVNLILDFTGGSALPNNAMSVFGSSMKTPPRDFDYAVVVTNSSFITTLVSIFHRVNRQTGKKLVLASTIEEARQFLENGTPITSAKQVS